MNCLSLAPLARLPRLPGRFRVSWLLAAGWLAMACPCGAQGDTSLAAAKDLYNQAAYADALGVLDKFTATAASPADAVEVHKYRAFCLVALGRTSEAQDAITRLLTAQPHFRLAESEVSRRVFTLFDETRHRVLPGIVQSVYDRAKRSYERRQFLDARSDFELVVSLAQEPDLPTDAQLVKDLGRLSRDFLDLIRLSAPPVSGRPLQFGSAVLPATKYIYDGTDPGIVPPVVVEQRLPPWPATARPLPGTTAVVEVTINERGEVESAVMAPPFNSLYDDVLVEAAKHWRYRPAMCGREAVKFRRRVQIVAGNPDGAQGPDGHAQDAAAR